MEKPITILQEELANNIVQAINDSQLHPALLEPVVKEIYHSVVHALEQQKMKEKKEYEENLKEATEE